MFKIQESMHIKNIKWSINISIRWSKM